MVRKRVLLLRPVHFAYLKLEFGMRRQGEMIAVATDKPAIGPIVWVHELEFPALDAIGAPNGSGSGAVVFLLYWAHVGHKVAIIRQRVLPFTIKVPCRK